MGGEVLAGGEGFTDVVVDLGGRYLIGGYLYLARGVATAQIRQTILIFLPIFALIHLILPDDLHMVGGAGAHLGTLGAFAGRTYHHLLVH